jgi:hypothetical protein
MSNLVYVFVLLLTHIFQYRSALFFQIRHIDVQFVDFPFQLKLLVISTFHLLLHPLDLHDHLLMRAITGRHRFVTILDFCHTHVQFPLQIVT